MPTSDEDHNIGSGPLRMMGRDPKARKNKTVGDMCVTDGVIIVAVAWATLFVLAYSLRHHNH